MLCDIARMGTVCIHHKNPQIPRTVGGEGESLSASRPRRTSAQSLACRQPLQPRPVSAHHGDYHTAGDDPEKSNIKKMKLFTQVVLVVLWELANADDSPRR